MGLHVLGHPKGVNDMLECTAPAPRIVVRIPWREKRRSEVSFEVCLSDGDSGPWSEA